jgi:hypothetical protein
LELWASLWGERERVKSYLRNGYNLGLSNIENSVG